MTEIALFHHALGQTPGFLAFADRLREAGHTVHSPDLYEGKVFDDLDRGVEFAQSIGPQACVERGREAVRDLPGSLVYAGFSIGTMTAQVLTQTRPGALGALLYHGGVPTEMLGSSWPAGVPLQVHTMDQDPWGDFDEMRALVDEVPDAEYFVYPGSGHLFADPDSGDYDEAASELLLQRTREFLGRMPEA